MQHAVHSLIDVAGVESHRDPAPARSVRKSHGESAANTETVFIGTMEELSSLQNGWDILAAPSGDPLVRHAWYASCAEAFCPPGTLHVIAAKRNDELVAVAPLILSEDRGVKRLEILGSSVLCEPVGFIYKDLPALKVLIDALLSTDVPFYSGRLKYPSPEHEMLHAGIRKKISVRFRRTTFSPMLPIVVSWNEYQNSISSSRRSTLRRAERRAAEYGTVTMELIAPESHNVHTAMNEAFDVEHASWKSRTRTSIRSNPLMERFFLRYAERMAALGQLRLSFLRIDGRAVAMQVGIEHADRFWVLKVGYNEQYSHCSPGIVLMHHTIRYAFERGLKTFEFLGRDEQWIGMWTGDRHEYISHWFYPATAGGVIALVRDGGLLTMNEFKKKFHGETR